MEEDIAAAEEPAESPAPVDEPSLLPPPSVERPRTGVVFGFFVVGLLLVAVLVLQVLNLVQANETRSDVDALDATVEDLNTNVAVLDGSVGVIKDQVESIEASQAAIIAGIAASGAQESAAPALPAGFLPRYEPGQQDRAIGLAVPGVAGPEYYSNTELEIDPSDGTRRVWLIWAHWCPHCQAELPPLSAWFEENGSSYNADLVTITTSIDETRGNPLMPYLDDSQFPFPVIIDADQELAARFGVSAFPFWVVTDADGTVMLRVTGRLNVDNVQRIFEQLDGMSA